MPSTDAAAAAAASPAMAASHHPITVRVAGIEQVTPLVKRFTLQPLGGHALPAFTGGSHIIVQMDAGGQRCSNAYSLMGSPEELGSYQIGVRRQDNSKGGSAYLHDVVKVGDQLRISAPNNLFGIDATARHHLLIAGGIGITPFLSQMHELRRAGLSHELHYAFRAPEHAAFRDEIQAAMRQAAGAALHTYADSERQSIDAPRLLAAASEGTHVYVCGPGPLIEAVRGAARQLGIGEHRVHFEKFAAPAQDGEEFTLVLARSGQVLKVRKDESILKVIERDTTVQVDCLCREGVCGTCETRIVEGEAEHRDQYLSDSEKAAQKTLLICVSRARGGRLAIDL